MYYNTHEVFEQQINIYDEKDELARLYGAARVLRELDSDDAVLADLRELVQYSVLEQPAPIPAG